VKYKIYDFTTDKFFPRTKNIFIPNVIGVFSLLDSLEFDGVTSTLSIYIYVYKNGAEENSPTEFLIYEEFLGHAAKAKDDWLNGRN
jgi:hypothetical protein